MGPKSTLFGAGALSLRGPQKRATVAYDESAVRAQERLATYLQRMRQLSPAEGQAPVLVSGPCHPEASADGFGPLEGHTGGHLEPGRSIVFFLNNQHQLSL